MWVDETVRAVGDEKRMLLRPQRYGGYARPRANAEPAQADSMGPRRKKTPGNPYMNAPIGILPACPRGAHRTRRSDFQGAGYGKTGPQTKGVHAPNKPA